MLIAQNALTVPAVDNVATVTYGGVAMVEVPLSAFLQTLGLEHGSLHGFLLGEDVPPGPQTVAVVVSGAQGKTSVAISVTASGDVQVVDTGTGDFTSGTAPFATLDTGDGVETFVAGVLWHGAANLTDIAPGADFTQVHEFDFGAQVAAWERRTNNPSGGSVTVDWVTTTDEAGVLAVALRTSESSTKLAMVV